MTPNPDQPHASLATTDAASTLAGLGYVRDAASEWFMIQSLGGTTRFAFGSSPTPTFGMRIPDGGLLKVSVAEFVAMQVVTETGSPKLEIAAFLDS